MNDTLRLTLKSLNSLTTLVLSHNKISSVADDMFEWNPLKLEKLYLGKWITQHFYPRRSVIFYVTYTVVLKSDTF